MNHTSNKSFSKALSIQLEERVYYSARCLGWLGPQQRMSWSMATVWWQIVMVPTTTNDAENEYSENDDEKKVAAVQQVDVSPRSCFLRQKANSKM